MLAISTDPAHSLADAFEIEPPGPDERPEIGLGKDEGTGRLRIAHVAAGASWRRWLQRHESGIHAIAEAGTYLDAGDIDRLLTLPAPGVDELVGLLAVLEEGGDDHDRIVVDAAPTGHTLRLLESPEALARMAALLEAMQEKARAVMSALTGVRRMEGDPVIEAIEADAERLTTLLRDRGRTVLRWITLPERLSLAETREAIERLEQRGLVPNEIIINRVIPESAGCPVCERRRLAQRQVVDRLRGLFPELPLRLLSDRVEEPRGRRGLRPLGERLRPSADGDLQLAESNASEPGELQPERAGSAVSGEERAWLGCLAAPPRRVLLVGGKGGVGKSTCASALAVAAVELLQRQTLLVSTDPAHSLRHLLDLGPEETTVSVAGGDCLRVLELDAARAYRRWRARHLDAVAETFGRFTGGAELAYDRRVVERLLDAPPPGIDELLALLTLLEEVREEDEPALVVVDTAPTGHAMRLLDMPETVLEWDHALLELLLKYREVVGLGDLAERLMDLARQLRRIRDLLGDPDRCGFLAVTGSGRLPGLETERLIEELSERRIPLSAVLVNRFEEGDAHGCWRCDERAREARRARSWARRLSAARASLPCGILLAPTRIPPPRGTAELASWGGSWIPDEP